MLQEDEADVEEDEDSTEEQPKKLVTNSYKQHDRVATKTTQRFKDFKSAFS